MTSVEASLRLLEGEPSEMAELQRVLEEAPTYFHLVTGLPPGPADAQSTYTILPAGKSYDDKFVLGIYRDDEMVGCVDLIRGHPNPNTAWLGLLLVSEKHQGRGIGTRAARLVEDLVEGWGECDRIRLAVVRINTRVIPFFKQLGYQATGEVKPYRYNAVESESLIYEKNLGD